MAEAIVGREAERAAIDGFLDAVPAGPAALLLEGDPGIGKTILWNEGVARAADRSHRVLLARPVESEAKLPFASLGDLFEGVPDEALVPLPRPQRVALEVALLREGATGPPPQPRAVALAFLGILRGISEEDPVVVAVDDLHWLDSSSLTALLFALRRLDREPVGLLASRRVEAEGDPDLARSLSEERLSRLRVGPLGPDELDLIIRGRLGAGLPRPLLVQLQRITGGNPFFALEIARALVRRDWLPEPGEPLPVPRNLREAVRERLAGLPDGAREAALAISALSRPTAEVVEAAMSSEGARSKALAQAAESGVVELRGDRIRFTHPLLASVVYSEATPSARREVHARLAEVVRDSEERARHLALAAERPDPSVARALDEAAERARARGAPEGAAELLEQARRLTPSDGGEDLGRRGIRAAEYHFEAGAPARARSLLEDVVGATGPGPGRAKALTLLA